ncbi:MAG TPA: SUMF1/EgtB/PvdO family nonheme iron enzyme, partial [Bacteroidia bacterium]|nr:SUMF1/EgtB/PvdO family nonheme iron enzyme [Bacteroidia bacterium]
TIVLPIYFSITDQKGVTRFPVIAPRGKSTFTPKNIPDGMPSNNPPEKTPERALISPANTTPGSAEHNNTNAAAADSLSGLESASTEKKEQVGENKKNLLPYFDEAGLAYFQSVKNDLFVKLLKLDNRFYMKMEPGSTRYQNREMLVSPFVMSDFPVTNLQYKVFLADLYRQGKINELEKCLPKEEVWKEYACGQLAENYFRSESYNYFPVVNLSPEAMLLFCEWMEEEMNTMLAVPKIKKLKTADKKKTVTVRLPYDYEWIYAADASYAIIPDCGGYNTIYDPSEGLVNGNFFKRTSQLSKQAKKKLNRIDQLNDINRFGMNEQEMIAIYREAMNFKRKKDVPAQVFSAEKTEDCCLGGHVVEMINTKDGGTTLRGCCWKDKTEYLKMAGDFKKFNGSPFVGFRIVLLTTNGTYKDPFW